MIDVEKLVLICTQHFGTQIEHMIDYDVMSAL